MQPGVDPVHLRPAPLGRDQARPAPRWYALFVYPEADHWHELRAFLPLAKIGEEKLPATDLEGFAPVTSIHVCAPRTLSHTQLVDLVEMSPSIHRLTREGTSWPGLLPTHLAATLSVRVTLFQKV